MKHKLTTILSLTSATAMLFAITLTNTVSVADSESGISPSPFWETQNTN